jgi:surfactin synthase thioesterase subunit
MLPGREKRIKEPCCTDFDVLVETIAGEMRPWVEEMPWAIFGHSMGALLAFEWARQMQCSTHATPSWLFLSGRRAPDTGSDTRALHVLPDRQFMEEVSRRYQGIPEEILGTPEFVEIYLPILRADIEMMESYCFQEREPLHCPITVFAGAADASVRLEQLAAWNRHTRSRFAVRLLPGGHFYPHGPLLRAISSILEESVFGRR